MKKTVARIALFLLVLTAAAGCGRIGGSGAAGEPGSSSAGSGTVGSSTAGSGSSGSGTSGSAERGETDGALWTMSAEAKMQGELLALTLHGYCVSELKAADLQALDSLPELQTKDSPADSGFPDFLTDLEGAAKVLEALRRAMEEKKPESRYHGEDITVLLPTTEEDRKSGLTPRELAGTVHGWQDDRGEFHILVSAGNEIVWIRWGGRAAEDTADAETAGQAETDAPAETAGRAEASGAEKSAGGAEAARGAVLITGKWETQ